MRGENLRSIYVFLFLQVVFFFFQMQSAQRFVEAFSLIPGAVLQGEVWRSLTYVFLSGSFFGSRMIGFFFMMMILYIIGGAIEEEFGTAAFVTLFLISTLVPVPIALLTGPSVIVGSFFIYYTLMIIYGDRYGESVFYLIIIPVKARWLAWLSVALLAFGLLGAPRAYIPIAAGVAAAWGFYRVVLAGGRRLRVPSGFKAARQVADRAATASSAHTNVEQFQETKRIAEEGSPEERARRIEHLESNITPGVNICPPVDFKPEAEDAYCARCEGFNECSARWLKARIEEDQNLDEAAKESAASRSGS